ncbi:MAG TPA: hypothetical protein VJ842_12520 [Pyrinomonadaceae bacterium]|nr:hypothetical protein [Pyrinomonadaceae bacterium]
MPYRPRRSRLPSPLTCAVLLSLLLPSSFTFGQTPKRTVNLGAGKAGEVLKIPQSEWNNINSFVFLIGFDVHGAPLEYAKRFGQMKSYPDLQAATRQWGKVAFPLVERLAEELSKSDIKDLLTRLDAAFNRRKTNPGGAQQEFQQTLIELNRKFKELSDLSDIIKQQFEKLDRASKAAILEYKSRNFPVNQWVSIGPKLSDVQQAIGLMNGRWGALLSDLQDLQRLVAKNQLDDIDIEVGLLTWNDIMLSASGFITNIPLQKKYLSGENYYDNCPVLDSTYYLMKNLFLIKQNLVLSLEPDSRTLKMRPRGAPNTIESFRQQWRFSKWGSGWWKIINRSKGNGYALDTGEMAPIGSYTGQAWRCMPMQSPGWVRLVNSHTGELMSLDTSPATFKARMEDTGNYSGQYWQFEEVTLPGAR